MRRGAFLVLGLIALFTIYGFGSSDGRIPESDETNNEASVTVEVKETRGMTLFYQEVEYREVRPVLYDETVIQGHDYMQAIYPIAPKDLNFFSISTLYTASGDSSIALRIDQVKIWDSAKKEAGRLGVTADKAVGIVPHNYFPGHGWFESNGNIFCVIPGLCYGAVLVEEGFWTGAAHEIGHTFGLIDEDPCLPTAGYWVTRGIEISPALSFMCHGPFRSFTDVVNGETFFFWPRESHYESMFRQLLKDGADDPPPILLIGGLVFSNGTIQILTFDWLPEGEVEVPATGDHSLMLLDSNGQVIQETAFVASATQFESPHGPPVDEVGIFTLAVHYPEGSVMLRIARGDQILVEFEVTASLLHSAIDRIPDSGFINNPNQRRNALHNKVDALAHEINAGNYRGAVQKLEHDIGPALERWLVDDYGIENASQYTKPEILHLVEELAGRLSSLNQ